MVSPGSKQRWSWLPRCGERVHAWQRSPTHGPTPGTVRHSLFALGYLLYPVGLGLGGAAHRGDELLVRTQDLLRLHGNLLLTLHDLNLNLFLPDLLLLAGPL